MRYANNKVEKKPIYGVVNIEKERSANINIDVIAEENSQPLMGKVLLELLDLIIDETRKLIPNASPEMLMELMDANGAHGNG
ncbi:MAG: hypothetical protein OCU22_06825, partial [Canidatus Methanoxibalbensis ujae]|nr:hypothetical protein [Candidatus Methanoxibalbensis ujae]